MRGTAFHAEGAEAPLTRRVPLHRGAEVTICAAQHNSVERPSDIFPLVRREGDPPRPQANAPNMFPHRLRASARKCSCPHRPRRELDPARLTARAAPRAADHGLDGELKSLGDLLFQGLDVGLQTQERSD